MTSTGSQPAKVVHHDKPQKHVHHGRTLAAWAGTTVALVAFILGGIAVVIQNWPLFWISVALLVASVIVTVVLQKMGYGAG
jgi:Na+-translocating ferredoxin:NAD+ oxidoreductase RnfD subunit